MQTDTRKSATVYKKAPCTQVAYWAASSWITIDRSSSRVVVVAGLFLVSSLVSGRVSDVWPSCWVMSSSRRNLMSDVFDSWSRSCCCSAASISVVLVTSTSVCLQNHTQYMCSWQKSTEWQPNRMAIVSNTCIQYHYRTFARVIYHAITVTAPPAWCSWVGKRETEVVIGEVRVLTTDWFVYLCPWLYTICQALKTFLDYCGRKQQKAMLANKDNSCSSLYVQLTVRIHLTIDTIQ